MGKMELFDLYEKMYFHEIDMRDKLSQRLQITLAILVVLFGFLGYMLESASYTLGNIFAYIFWILFVLATISIFVAVYWFVRSWHGWEYEFLPAAEQWEAYRESLKITYSEFGECDRLVNKYMKENIIKSFVECSSQITSNNDRRSWCLHWANAFLIYAVIVAFLAFIPFCVGLTTTGDVRNSNQAHQVQTVEPGECSMSELESNKPPPPPPPPPKKRIVKEGGREPKKDDSAKKETKDE